MISNRKLLWAHKIHVYAKNLLQHIQSAALFCNSHYFTKASSMYNTIYEHSNDANKHYDQLKSVSQ